MSEVLDYRVNLVAQKRWSKLDTGEPVIARWNGLPITKSCLGAEVWLREMHGVDTAPSEYCAPESDSA